MIGECKTIILGGYSGVAAMDTVIIDMLNKYMEEKTKQGFKVMLRTLDSIIIGKEKSN